ncbi:hypothetical protein GAYE_SCF27MG4671 [Galdieria yellowstonensis]|uniref:Myb-like DNA-binding domain containing protein n=1 Tax=Galdieria yellowstonensis TaxID=3028027 RepID=A0AAV9IHF2_9RHOD|nr:hypothetical protein GAYE_SCF27MG4671 [Galdieria yellowstonensis]
MLTFCTSNMYYTPKYFLAKKHGFLCKPCLLDRGSEKQKPVRSLGLQCAHRDDKSSSSKSFEKRKKRLFTVEEDKLIIRMREKDKLSWREIGKRLNRHGYVCNIRYKSNLSSRYRRFDEDNTSSQLEVLVKELGPDWPKIAEILQFSNPEDVQAKYSELVARNKQRNSSMRRNTNDVRSKYKLSSAPKAAKQSKTGLVECLLTVTRRQDDSFTVEEDKYLLEQLRKYGSDWNRIVEEFPSKSRRTVMKRLDQLSIRYGSMSGRKLLWTQDEDNLLIDLFIQHGRCWSLISRSLFGKSSSQIFRRFLKLRKDGKVTITKWTLSDDKRLVCSVGLYNENWPLIARVLKYWSYSECERRYRTLQRENRLLPLERTVMKEVRKGKSSELLFSCTIRHDEYGLARERCSSALQEVFFG